MKKIIYLYNPIYILFGYYLNLSEEQCQTMFDTDKVKEEKPVKRHSKGFYLYCNLATESGQTLKNLLNESRHELYFDEYLFLTDFIVGLFCMENEIEPVEGCIVSDALRISQLCANSRELRIVLWAILWEDILPIPIDFDEILTAASIALCLKDKSFIERAIYEVNNLISASRTFNDISTDGTEEIVSILAKYK